MQLTISYKQILAIALPIIIGNFFHSIISFTDTIFMGRVGEAELAACGYASMYYMVLAMIGYSFALGAQIIIARRAGENDRRSIGRVMDNLFYLLTGFSILLFLFIRFGTDLLMGLLIPDPAVMAAAVKYLEVRSYGVVFVFQVFIFGALFTGLGRTMIIIWGTMFMALVNIFLNYGLVFGNFGLPALGITGAGIASLISEIIAFVIIAAYLFKKKFHRKYLFFLFKKLDYTVIKRINSLAGPIVIQSVVGALSWFILFTLIVNYIGKQELAFSNVVKIIYTFFALPTWGLAGATNTLVSNIIGQGKGHLIIHLVKKIVIISLGIAVLTMTFLYLYPETVISLFTDDPELIEGYMVTLRVVIGAILLLSIGNIIFRAVTGTGAAKQALKIEFISVIVYVIFAYLVIVVLDMGLAAAWSVEIVYWLVLGGLSLYYLKRGNWLDLKV